MKKVLFFFIFCFLSLGPAGAQPQRISFRVSDGLNNSVLQAKIEANLSRLLTEIDEACRADRQLDLTEIDITRDASYLLDMLWGQNHFFCAEPPLVACRVLRTYGDGWQVRDIPVEVLGIAEGDKYQDFVIDLDTDGTITMVNRALDPYQYRKVMQEGTSVQDSLRRGEILDYVEQFRTAYDRKDLEFMNYIFSDDALIITGKVIKLNGKDNVEMKDEVHYRKQNKTEYLQSLSRVFKNNERIRVSFNDVIVTQHPTKVDLYGVQVRQTFHSTSYSDEGYVFMLWDFQDKNHPQIHVRTWQPYWLNQEHTKALEKNQIITIKSFNL